MSHVSAPASSDRVKEDPGSHLPHKVDWNEAGYVTEARDHYRNCNAQSYAMTASDMVEALHKKRTGYIEKLSAKQFIDC